MHCLSRIINKPHLGKVAGKCIFCATETTQGQKADLGHNFTAYQFLQDGSCICEYCYELYKNQDFRKKAWILEDEKLEFVKDKKIILDFLLNPRGNQFLQYITFTWQKQGWLQLLYKLNSSQHRYFVGVDDTVLFISRELAQQYFNTSSMLMKYAMKTEIETGNYYVSSLRKLVGAGLQDRIAEFQQCAKDPLWRLVVKLQ